MKNNRLKGISLIVLVITIIVIIIIAGAVILNLTKNNPMDSAKKAAFLSDLDSFKNELSIYESKQYADNIGDYDATLLQADETSVTYNGNTDTTKTISDLITSIEKSTKYAGQFVVVDGKLIYQGSDAKNQDWARDYGVEVVVFGEPKVSIVPPAQTLVEQGTDIVYTVKFISNIALTTIDLTGKVEVLDDKDVALITQPNLTIGTVSGTSLDTSRQVDITISTTDLIEGSYKLKIKSGVATNANNISNSTDSISLIGFDIVDNVPPENPTMIAAPTTLTNGDVTVTITYSADSVTKEYSFDSTNWNSYTVPVVVTENNTTVYARGKDSALNESGLATLTVSNIDKILPNVVFGTNGGSGETGSTTVTANDENGINVSTLQYVWDTQNITTPSSGWATFTNGATLTKENVNGTYYLWIKASDNAGNNIVSKTNEFVLLLPAVVNKPVLATGMTAKKWDGSSWVTVSSPDTDTTWYNYGTKQWANAQTLDGSMWVWIPRYEYMIPTPHSSTAQTIAVKFLENTSTTATEGYTVHPAFTFGTTELTGIWVAKFEASGLTNAIASKPTATSTKNSGISIIFTACRNMETTNGARYGWGTTGVGIDTHLMKNVEWGAIAYLSSSAYGKTGEVWINPYYNASTYANSTGRAGTSASSGSTTSTYAYNDATYGVNASTTGNIYGIYDMSGGAYEYVAAYVNNGNAKLTTYGANLVNAASEYKDVYTSSGDTGAGNYAAASSRKGDAVYETSSSGEMTASWTGTSWYGDWSCMPRSDQPFFVRGNLSNDTTNAGVFAFGRYEGGGTVSHGFRPCLLVDAAL